MSTMEDRPQGREQQLTHEDQAVLAIQRVETLVTEALIHPNSTTMDAYANWGHPSWKTPINHEESGHTVGALEVTRRGLIGKPRLMGTSLTRTVGTESESFTEEYWIDPQGETLFKFTGTRGSIEDIDKLSKCNPIETKEVMDEFRDIIEGALHPEKQTSRNKAQESADASSPAKDRQRGRFVTWLTRKVFDPSKVFPSNKSK